MKRDEKSCPRCKATINSAAHLCKNCGHRFPEAEIKLGIEQAQPSKVKAALGALGVVGAFLLFAKACAPEKDSVDKEQRSEAAEAANPYADKGQQQLWIVKGQEAIKARLKDPDSAEFRNVGFYSGGPAPVACGEVNAKNGFGGYTGYERFIASGSKLAILASDMRSSAEMQKAWEQMCVKAETDGN